VSQGTRVFRSREATMLLGVEGLAVVSVVEVDGVRQVHAVTDDPTAAACPACGVISTAVKGHAVSSPRDLPYGPVPIRLVWHKRRWRCREPLCERASFTESIPAIPARSRLTSRLRTECGEGIADRFTCVAAGAVHYGLSWRTAHAAYVRHVAATLAAPLPPVTVLGIDEIRRGKTRWVKDPDTGRWVKATDRWLTGLVDAAGDGGLLAHVEGRAAAAIVEWVEAQPDTWRAAVAHVCLDLSASYAKAIRQALPDATLVADRFHLVRLANDMLTQVRQDAETRTWMKVTSVSTCCTPTPSKNSSATCWP
jgi:transposase